MTMRLREFLILGTFSAFCSFLPVFRLAILSFSCSARARKQLALIFVLWSF